VVEFQPGIDEAALLENPDRLGALLEAFVVNELTKQATWSGVRVHLHHFRTHVGAEVDVVLEDRKGRCVAVEVRASASPGANDVKGIEAFAQIAGRRFHRGVLLYTGREVVPFGARIHAMPVSALWELGSR
jgi:uncharacterized protein